MKMKKIALAVLGVTAISLVGCTSPFENSSTATTPDAPSVSAGKAFDWYIKNALVFADFNGNGLRDALSGSTTLEPATTSDATGAYSLSVPAALGSNYVVVVKGGTDIATNQPFKGVLKAGPTDPIASPATTLKQEFKAAGVADPEAAVKAFLGLPSSANLSADPAKDTALYTASTKATALISSLATVYATATTTTSTDTTAIAQTTTSIAIKALAQAIKAAEVAKATNATVVIPTIDSSTLVAAVNDKAVVQLTTDTTKQAALKTDLNNTATAVNNAVIAAATAASTAVATAVGGVVQVSAATTAQNTVTAQVTTAVQTAATSSISTANKVAVEVKSDDTSGVSGVSGVSAGQGTSTGV